MNEPLTVLCWVSVFVILFWLTMNKNCPARIVWFVVLKSIEIYGVIVALLGKEKED